MEIENVNNKANVGVTLGGVGLGVALLNAIHNGSGLFGGLLGGGAGNMANAAATVMCGDSAPITRYEFKMAQDFEKDLRGKDLEIAILKSEQNTEIKIADVYSRLKGDMLTMERNQNNWNTQQSVNNAQMTAAITANATSIAGLQNCCDKITKIVVPNSSICPGWGPVTVEPTPAT